MFSVTSALSSCNSSPPKVPWHHILWGPSHVLRFSFIAWLTIKGRLSTKTLLRSRELRTSVGCVLCSDGVADVLDHLFFSCHFSQGVWILLLDRCGLTRNLVNWRDVVTWMARKTKGKSLLARIVKVMQTAAIYYIRKENNTRFLIEPLEALCVL